MKKRSKSQAFHCEKSKYLCYYGGLLNLINKVTNLIHYNKAAEFRSRIVEKMVRENFEERLGPEIFE